MRKVYLGRFMPFHEGHRTVVDTMIRESGKENPLLILGSSNATLSFRNLFSYSDRVKMIRKLYPDLPILSIPDFEDDEEWYYNLSELLKFCGCSMKIGSVCFYSGSMEDVQFFRDRGHHIRIVNRYDGTTIPTSASEVRDALLEGRSIDYNVPFELREDVHACFRANLEKLKKQK